MPISLTTHKAPKIGGVTRFSTSDYPNHLAAVIFLQGCPWRCHYCHNPHFQTRTTRCSFDWFKLMAWLQTRIGLLDAVVFSGGEPCADPALPMAVDTVKSMGFKVGLHSGGGYPKRLQKILASLDWIGFDIKAPFESYETVTGISDSGKPAEISAKSVLDQGVSYEFRTTLHPSLLPEEALWAMASRLQQLGVQHYVWQMFRSTGCLNHSLNSVKLSHYPSSALIQKVSALFPQFEFRSAY